MLNFMEHGYALISVNTEAPQVKEHVDDTFNKLRVNLIDLCDTSYNVGPQLTAVNCCFSNLCSAWVPPNVFCCGQ